MQLYTYFHDLKLLPSLNKSSFQISQDATQKLQQEAPLPQRAQRIRLT